MSEAPKTFTIYLPPSHPWLRLPREQQEAIVGQHTQVLAERDIPVHAEIPEWVTA